MNLWVFWLHCMNDTEVLQDFAWVPRELGSCRSFFIGSILYRAGVEYGVETHLFSDHVRYLES